MNATDFISRTQYDSLRRCAVSGMQYDYNKTVKEGKARMTVRMYSHYGRNISSIEYRCGESVSGGTIRNVLEYSCDEFCRNINESLKKLGILEEEAEQLCLW